MSEGEALQAEVLNWLRDTGRGYKAAEREFGVPRSTVQGWVQAIRRGEKPAVPNPRTTERARRRAESDDTPPPTGHDEP